MVSHILSAEVSPRWRLIPCFRSHKKCPFPLNRGAPSVEVTDTKIMSTFSWTKFSVPLNGGVSIVAEGSRQSIKKFNVKPGENNCYITYTVDELIREKTVYWKLAFEIIILSVHKLAVRG